MTINDVGMLFEFIGGLGMFLYGMNIMADGLQKTAGNKMKTLLKVLTGNRLMAVLVGALITAIIQSSSATTVMVVGFVNAGLFNLSQAVGVIMGANIGTTITSWLVSMNEWGDALKPEFFAPLLIGFGAFMILFAKKNSKKQVGEILVGFGVLFIGLSFMSGAIKPYSDSPIFSQMFTVVGQNPLLGILAGAVVTAIIQSSSASVGILQTLAMNGVVNWGSAVYITLGQNIGTCVTALISSAGAHKTAKRAAVIHLLFNVTGTIIFGLAMFVVFQAQRSLAAAPIDSVQISIFHSIFNIVNTVVLFPFANKLVTMSGYIVRSKEETKYEENALDELENRLDERILETPSFAVETAVKEVVNMGLVTMDNMKRVFGLILEGNDKSALEKVYMSEEVINGYEKQLTEYLVKINNLSLNDTQHFMLKNLLYTISDIERVGDHCEDLAKLAELKIEQDVTFSDSARVDLESMMNEVMKSYEAAINSRLTQDGKMARDAEDIENKVDEMEEYMRDKHIERLTKGLCKPANGLIFLDVVSNLERIADHADNIAAYVESEL